MRRIVSILTALMLLCCLAPAAVGAAGETARPGYVLSAESAEGVCTLTVSVRGATAYSGRLAVRFDPGQLALQGTGMSAVKALSGVSLTADGVPLDTLVDGAGGSVGFAWYGTTVKALERDVPIVSIRFTQTAGALDSGSFGLRHVPDTGFGSWTGAATMQVENGTYYPSSCSYLKTGAAALDVTFDYDGAERPAEGGHAVTLQCRDILGKPVAATVSLDGRTWSTGAGGDAALRLQSGTYRCRVQADGYGDRYETLTISGDATIPVTFQTDAMLVEQARGLLAIGFAEGDSASAVTRSVTLPAAAPNGVSVQWESDRPDVITRDGLVYRPGADAPDAAVTLTATLKQGAAEGQKQFAVTVLHKQSAVTPPSEQGFTDLAGYDWAKDAILRLNAAGIIKGTSATTYSPAQPIKRGDFMLLVMNLMAPDASTMGAPFADVPAGSYYESAIRAARALGIAEGAGDNRFLPQQPITRQEMAVMLARALRVTGYFSLNAAPGDLTGFSDHHQIAPYARTDLAQMVGAGYMVGSGGALHPMANTTRAEAAVFIDRIRTAANG